LSDNEKEAMQKSGYIWGCDKCQRVCSYNKDIKETAFKESELIYNLKYDDISDLSEKEFKEKYPDRAFTWRGIKPLKRNLKIIEKL
jgi:epoxyqueuosine reductase QueG